MGVYSATWEDEENYRIVKIAVEYEIEDDQVQILAVTPTNVTFIDQATMQVTRSIKIHTPTARRILTDAYAEKVGMEQLEATIRDQALAAR